GWNHQAEPRAGFGPPGPTGNLKNYFGNVERILAQTLVRGIEGSLGLQSIAVDGSGSGPPSPASAGDVNWAWPIDCSLVCESPWFEGWVVWKKHSAGAQDSQFGHVTLLFHTPGHGGQVEADPLEAPGSPTREGYADDCDNGHPWIGVCREQSAHARQRGMWIITHSNHITIGQDSTGGTP